jgi:hypothetical protein
MKKHRDTQKIAVSEVLQREPYLSSNDSKSGGKRYAGGGRKRGQPNCCSSSGEFVSKCDSFVSSCWYVKAKRNKTHHKHSLPQTVTPCI